MVMTIYSDLVLRILVMLKTYLGFLKTAMMTIFYKFARQKNKCLDIKWLTMKSSLTLS